MLLTSEPAFVEDLVRLLRELATLAIFAAVTVRLAQRIHRAPRPLRRTLGPVLAVACFRCAAFVVLLVARRLAPESQVVEVSMWLLVIAIPMVAVAFLVGLARWWLFMAAATQRLAHRLRGHPSPEDLQRALADVFDDADLVVVYRAEDGDSSNGDGRRSSDRPSRRDGRSTEIRDGDRLVAAIVHDSALGQDESFVAIAELVRLDDAGQLPAVGGGALTAGGGGSRRAGVSRRRRRRTPPDRAQSARWRSATARRARDPSGLGGRRGPATSKVPPRCGDSRLTSKRHSRRYGRWPAAAPLRRSLIAVWSKGYGPRPAEMCCGPRSWRLGSDGTHTRSRVRRTSVVLRRCRTRPSTPEARPRPWSSSPMTERFTSRCATTAKARPGCRRRRRRVGQHARPARGRRWRARDRIAARSGHTRACQYPARRSRIRMRSGSGPDLGLAPRDPGSRVIIAMAQSGTRGSRPPGRTSPRRYVDRRAEGDRGDA